MASASRSGLDRGAVRFAAGGRQDRSGLDEPARRALGRELAAALRGDVCFDAGTRAVFATDSSNYRQVPLGVVFPRDHDDLLAAVAVASRHGAPVLGRGAGTSLAGQGCNVAVVVDTSRYLTGIIEVDPQRRLARVQAGVVLDDLRRAAELHGLTFGPDPATHAWCTVGGMIGNNSCGTHGLYTGVTADNVAALRAVTYRGDVLDLGGYEDEAAYARAVAAGGPRAPVLAGLRELARRYEADIRTGYPALGRRVSGFNLDRLLPDRGFQVAQALVGTESTCVLVSEATVRLAPSPAHRRLVVLGYPDVFAAADAVPAVLAHPLLGLEGFDDTLVGQMRAHRLNLDHLGLLPDGRGWLVAEVGGDDPADADRAAAELVADRPGALDVRRYDDPATQARVWLIRESGLGATALRPDGRHNLEGWEDAAVPPPRLGEYLRGIGELWREFGYSGAWYGHFGQGCVHTRNDFDLGTDRGLRSYRRYVETAADLVVSLGGSLSGEHGDGQSRAELLGRMYPGRLLDAFGQFKAVFDPDGRMNPGKVVDPYPLDSNLRLLPVDEPRRSSVFALADDSGSLAHAAARCVGVGRCRRDDAGTMCPSYRATRDERHSTRGRAKLLVEMFAGEVTPASWRNEDVRAALDLCLSCKGCLVDCPTHVDMATYKAEFLHHHYRGRLRPAADYALGLVPWWARLAGASPALANAALSLPGVAGPARSALGLTTRRPAPTFAPRPFRRTPSARARARTGQPTVVVWPDTFTDAYRPDQAERLVASLEALGERVVVPSAWACCARPLYDAGMLTLARRALRRLLDVLEPFLARGLPVVVPEPSCLAAFRDELPALLAADPRARRLASLARSPAEHVLAAELAPAEPATDRGRAVLHPHCHQRAVGGSDAEAAALARLGYRTSVLDAGCCGLAGSFGFRADHEPVSRRIGEAQWLPAVEAGLAAADGPAELVVDGFSCATQLGHLGGPPAVSFVDLLHRGCAAGRGGRC